MKTIIRHQINNKVHVKITFKRMTINIMMMGCKFYKIKNNNRLCRYLINMRSTCHRRIKHRGRRKTAMIGIKQLKEDRKDNVKINQCLDWCHQKVANRQTNHQKQEWQVLKLKCSIINVVHSKTIQMYKVKSSN